jgi:hypothetical protein
MCAENVKKKLIKIAFVTIPLMLLAATVAISFVITEDAFAKNGRYTGDTSQAAAASNDCLNPILDSNNIDNTVGVGNCGGTISQQDESGSAAAPITSQTANPTIELQRATTTTQPPGLGAPTPETCEECFGFSEAEEVAFLTVAIQAYGEDFPTLEDFCNSVTDPQITDLADIATLLGPGIGDIEEMNLDKDRINQIVQCLADAFGTEME